MAAVVGCIADDMTGATDLSDALCRLGIATTQLFGVPEGRAEPGTQALVVGLKTRNLPAGEAVEQSLAVLRWLQVQGVHHVFVKYCSTFDSTAAGNIGPVTDSLADALKPGLVVHAPSYPANDRTVYQGHLFVRASLLSDTGMRDHPLTPMTDSNLVRVLRAQTSNAVGLLPLTTIRQGVAAARAELLAMQSLGTRHVIADAVWDDDLDVLAAATVSQPVVGGSAAFGAAFAAANLTTGGTASEPPPAPSGGAAVLVGSVSCASRAQVAAFSGANVVALVLRPQELASDRSALDSMIAAALSHVPASTLLVSVENDPTAVARTQAALGREYAAKLVEMALGRFAVALVDGGVRRLVVAGGETSGAVVDALGVREVRIGPSICTGVPWTVWSGPSAPVALAFKSGNFGGETFFSDAFASFDGEGWGSS